MGEAHLHVEADEFKLPVVKATAGPDGIVMSSLRNNIWVSLDPGVLTTAQCETRITNIDGEHSIQRYRGYTIAQLCEQTDFQEDT